MTSKYLSFGFVAAGALLVGAFTQPGTNIENIGFSDYSPRVYAEKTSTQYDGAEEIHRMLMADIETGEINVQGLQELRKEVQKFANKQALSQSKSSAVSWTEMGPDNIGGRTRALAIHPDDESVLYAGAVSGGLWRSTDEANSWSQLLSYPNLMVGSIAVAGNGDIYVGSGSVFDGGDGAGSSGFRGRGIWYSSDNGDTFTMVDGTDPGEFNNGSYSATDALVADPTDDSKVWFGSNNDYGFLIEGVISEMPGSAGGPPAGVGDIAIAPDGSYMLIGALNSKVYRSTSSDFDDFELIASGSGINGNLPGAGINRVRVAISQNTEGDSYAFALYADGNSFFGGLYVSDQDGEEGTWDECWPDGSLFTPLERSQGYYDLALGISKSQPELAYVGGISLWRSGPNQQAEQAAAAFDFPGFSYGVHADIQDIVVAPSGTMYVTTDGGIYKSTDNGYSYTECNHDYNVTQFYGIAHSAGPAVIGGTQDNGSLVIPEDNYFLDAQNAVEVHGGDGFDCAFSQVTESEEHQYAWFAASQNGGLVRGTLAPENYNNLGKFFDEDILELENEEGDIGQFYTCLRLYEDTEDEDSQRNLILVNPYGVTVTDSSFEMNTSNQNLPFTYTLGPGEELLYHDMIIRPDLLLEEPLIEDPNYFWLEPQVALEEFICLDDTLGSDTVEVIADIIPNFLDTIMVIEEDTFDIQIDLGSDTVWEEEVQFNIVEVCDTMYFHPGDTIYDEPGRILVHDPYTTIFAIGFVGSQGIWITRDALNYNTTPDWIRIGDAPGGWSGTKSIEFVVNHEKAGDVMFVSGWDGKLLRITGLSNVYSQEDVEDNVVIDQLLDESPACTGISINPNDPNHIVISFGGYGTMTNGKIRECTNALSDSPTWDNIQVDDLPKMPIYDVLINSQDASGNTILAGTEYGVFVSTDGGTNWEISNYGMSSNLDPETEELCAPVFDLKQQWRTNAAWSNPSNTGSIYAGTHGRGIFRSDDYLGAEEVVDNTDELETLLIYPNPVTANFVNVSTAGFSGKTLVEVYDLQGRVVLSENLLEARSTERVVLDVNELTNGTYVVRMANSYKHLATKLVIRK